MSRFLVVDLAADVLSAEDQDILKHPAVAGVILFTRNAENFSQLKNLTAQIKKCNPALLIMLDQEGGRVQRFKHILSDVPSMREFGQQFHKNPKATQDVLYKAMLQSAQELKELQIDLNLAPVLDVEYTRSSVIGERSFGNAQIVIALAQTVIRAFHDAGLRVTGKHFPGHGGVMEDSHLQLPIDSRSFLSLSEDLKPYQALSPSLDAIMPAHVKYTAVDSQVATFSSFWLREVLRKQLGFQGLIISDDLSMGAVQTGGNCVERADRALKAGCDLLLVCNRPQDVHAILDSSLKSQKETPLTF